LKAKEKAQKAANSRWGGDALSIPPSNAQAMLEQCPSPSPSPIKTKTTDPNESSSGDSETTKKKRRFGSDEVEKIRLAYPLKKAPEDARRAIEKALATVADRGESDPVGFLLARIEAMKAVRARDEAKGAFVPHLAYPASWFNKSCYDEEGLQPVKNCRLPDGTPCTAAEYEAQTGWKVMGAL
jgi:hypothetical protein